MILEHNLDTRNYKYNNDWFDLKARINAVGWTASVIREFRRVTTPRLVIKPPCGLGEVRPPSGDWEKIQFSELGQCELVFPKRHNEDLGITDDVLPQIINILEQQLTAASELLSNSDALYFKTPSCYPDRKVEGKEFFSESGEILLWFVTLFDRMADMWPDLANAHATIWPATEQFFFRKLKLYAFNKKRVFKADHVAEEVLALKNDEFWDTYLSRELLFLLVDRWKEFSQVNRNQITERIVGGPSQIPYCSDEEFPVQRDELAASYASYLKSQGCELNTFYNERLAEMIKGISGWNNGWANSVVTSKGSYTQRIHTDEKPDVILDLPVNEVIDRARKETGREFDGSIMKQPFLGLVKANPRKALSALTIKGKAGDYPNEFWSSMIKDLPTDVTPRLKRVFLNRIARLPNVVIVELRHTLSYWLEQNFVKTLKFDAGLSWTVYEHVVEGILSGGTDSTKGALRDIRQTGELILPSRRTFGHALNGPIGRCTKALIHSIPGEEQDAGLLIPDDIKSRIEYLFNAPGEGADHAVAIAASNLNWLMFVDPVWTKEHLIPMLVFDNPVSEPAWNGFLHDRNGPSNPVVRLIKPSLLELIPWLKRFSWEKELSIEAALWLGRMRIFKIDEEGGLCRGEMRPVLRSMSDETRNRFIAWLGFVGQKEDNGWAKYIIPLINEDWPRERRYRTLASAKAWIGLLGETGDDFHRVYETVKTFLAPLETEYCPLYRFTREHGNKKPLTTIFPESTLDLMNRITPLSLTRPPLELQKVLALIEDVEPRLITDQRYLRLTDLVEKN